MDNIVEKLCNIIETLGENLLFKGETTYRIIESYKKIKTYNIHNLNAEIDNDYVIFLEDEILCDNTYLLSVIRLKDIMEIIERKNLFTLYLKDGQTIMISY